MINYLQQGVINTAIPLCTDFHLITRSLKSNRIYASFSRSQIYNGAGNFRGKQNGAAQSSQIKADSVLYYHYVSHELI